MSGASSSASFVGMWRREGEKSVGSVEYLQAHGLTLEKAAARAVRHRAEKEVKTRAEKAADRRAGGLPDNVRPSKAGCRAGQYYIVYYVDKSYSKAIKAKFKKNFSVVKPGTNGYYASTTVAERVRDEWIKKKRPESWMAKERS